MSNTMALQLIMKTVDIQLERSIYWRNIYWYTMVHMVHNNKDGLDRHIKKEHKRISATFMKEHLKALDFPVIFRLEVIAV